MQRAEQVAQYFMRKRGVSPEKYERKRDEPFGKGPVCCPNCGSTKMLLIRIWSKAAGVVQGAALVVPVAEQLAFAF